MFPWGVITSPARKRLRKHLVWALEPLRAQTKLLFCVSSGPRQTQKANQETVYPTATDMKLEADQSESRMGRGEARVNKREVISSVQLISTQLNAIKSNSVQNN